jgi:probable phosphoglycerate mutase
MALKRIYLIRHGETNYNLEGIVQGRLIDSDLNYQGQAQRDLLYQRFSGIHIDHIYLSTLKRTYQTMEPFIKNGIPYSCDKNIDELCFGDIEGTPIFDHEGNSVLKKVLAEWKNGNFNIRFDGGESPLEAYNRIEIGFEKIMSHESENKIIVCLHQRILRIVMCFLLGKPLSDMDNYPHHNTGITTLDYNYETKKFILKELNDFSHLNVTSDL